MSVIRVHPCASVVPSCVNGYDNMRRALLATVMALGCASAAHAADAGNNPLPNGGFEDGAAGWTLFGEAAIEKGEAFDGERHLTARCTGKSGGVPSGAKLMGIAVKPNTGYIARCRLRRPKGGVHLTFGVLKSNGGFLVCRDGYTRRTDRWGESILPFRTGDESQIGIYVARRYGKGELWFDAVELVEDNSVRIGDMSPRPGYAFPTATPTEQRRGYTVSRRNWMQLVYPSMYPSRGETSQELTCRLSPDEYEPVTFSITSLRELKNVTVDIAGDLQGPDGAVLQAGNVTIGVVRTITRWLTSGAPLKPGQRYERRPLFLFPNHPVNISARETRQFWLTILAPPNLPAGRYAGRVTVSAQGAPTFELPLHVDVLPIKLALPEVTYGMYYRHHCQYPEFKTEEFFRRSMADMKAHGMNSFSVYVDLTEKKPDGTLALNADGGKPYHYKDRSCGLNWQMGILDECSLLSHKHPLLLLADSRFNKDPGLVASLDAYRMEKNWPEFLIYLVDEPSTPKKIALAKQLNDLVHKAGVRTTTAMGKPGELAAYYDVWIVGAYAGLDVTELAERMGKERWAYMCTWNGCQPRNDRFYAGYDTWTRRFRGNWLWCYTERTGGRVASDGKLELGVPGYEDPWRVAYVLPSKDGNIPTLGWEARREGVDDYRYLQTLRDAARAALDARDERLRARALAAQRFLKEVEQRSCIPATGKQYATAPEYTYNFIMHPNLEPEDYDDIRRRAADYIMELQGDGR